MGKLLFKCAFTALFLGCVLFAGSLAYWRTEAFQELERTEDTARFREMPGPAKIGLCDSTSPWLPRPPCMTPP